jgi:hypothetical protein
LLAACGPDAKEPAEHGRVCGHESPFRILELDDDRPIATVHQASHSADGRVLRIGYGELTAGAFGASGPLTYEYWSIGECGESPRRIEMPVDPKPLEHWPDEIFSCDRETGELEIVDLSGARPSNVVFQTNGCDFQETQWGLLQLVPADDDTAAAVLLPFPDDPWTQTSEPRTLIDAVRLRPAPPYGVNGKRLVFGYLDDTIYALSPTFDLLRFSMIDGTTTIEATNVREFEISLDQRWLVWQDVAEIGNDPDWPVGMIFLRDRQSGTQTRLADAPLAAVWVPSSLAYADLGIVLLQLGHLYEAPMRMYRLDDLSFVDLPLGVGVLQHVPDGRLLVGDAFGRGNYALVDPRTASGTAIFDGYGDVRVGEDHLEILDGIFCCISQDERAEGGLWRSDFDGNRELLADRITAPYQFLPDGRLLTPLDANAKWRGDLVAIDPDDRVERVVDDHTVFYLPMLDDDTIVYGVVDRERTGVWLARLAPRD